MLYQYYEINIAIIGFYLQIIILLIYARKIKDNGIYKDESLINEKKSVFLVFYLLKTDVPTYLILFQKYIKFILFCFTTLFICLNSIIFGKMKFFLLMDD